MKLKTKRKAAPKKVIKWTDAKIPADVFFDILDTGDYTLLGTAPFEELEAVFDKIFDEYVRIDNNQKVLAWYKKMVKTRLLTNQIAIIENLLYIITFTPLNKDERLMFIDKLNDIEGVRVNFKKDKPIMDEISRVKNVVIGSLQNRLNMEKNTEKKEKEAVKYSYKQDLAGIESILGYNMPENMSLEMFLYRKKTAQEKAKAHKNVKKNGK